MVYLLMIDIGTRLAELHAELRLLAAKNETQSAVPTLIAVSKKQPVEAVSKALEAGQRHFGESYLQDARPKIDALSESPAIWHFIGPVQSNKCREIAKYFDWVHSIDRLKIAERLSSMRDPALPPLQVLLQVNIDADHGKSGLEQESVYDLAKQVVALPQLRLRGLMTILQADTPLAAQKESFDRMQELLRATQQSLGLNDTFSELSMGMSGDWRAAVESGSTMVRIGSAIFGRRPE